MGSRKKASGGFHTPFTGLGDALRRGARQPAPGPPAPAPSPAPAKAVPPARTPARPETDDEAKTFEQAMRGVTPLSEADRRRRAPSLVGPGPKAPAPSAHAARA